MRFFSVSILAVLFGSLSLHAQDRVTGHNFASRSEVIAQNGMAATSHPLATMAALDILKMGGSAVDAAIAANAILGLMEPTGCGIGGDLFALIWDADANKLHGLNASGRSPKSLPIDYFHAHEYAFIPRSGPLSVSVPGAVDGWFQMHAKFGKLSMQQILQPAIDYAYQGFPVSELVAHYLALTADRLGHYPNFSETYMPEGKMPAKGEIFRNPDLARTYEKLARQGRDVFYKGEIASAIVDYMQENGGFLNLEDLETHRSEWVEPVSTSYRGYDVWQIPPNGQGIAVLQLLNLLEGFDIAGMGFGSAAYMHHFTEAKKLVYEDRAAYYADMDFSPVPVQKLISKEYADERRKLIDTERAAKRFDAGLETQPNTIYLTVADRDGNMVSLIQSNYRGMGSGMTPYGLGFVLQNRGEGFTLHPGHFNTYAPGKRPFHTIIPGFITLNGEAYMSFGVMGGGMQPQGQAQVVINMLDFGMNLQEAGDAPRIHHYGSSEPTGHGMQDGGILNLESGFDYEVIRALLQKGHTIQWASGPFGGYQAILWDAENQVYYGASESRKDGMAAGY